MAQPSVTFPAFRDTNIVLSATPLETVINKQTNSASKAQDDSSFGQQSGFYGQVFVAQKVGANADPAPVPVKAEIAIYDASGQWVSRIQSNPVGQFYSFVKPGNYTLVTTLSGVELSAMNLGDIAASVRTNSQMASAKIAVKTNRLTKANIQIRGSR
jgi:hypothetical protein